ncbi:MAG: TRAP transporter small permease subunit [Dehalococcoidales bacterium]|nr:TRAP transporter small permease subunit [Dehalococcoidales bacterium]
MRKVLRFIDYLSDLSGRSVRWLAMILVLVMTTEVVMRYGFNHPTMWAYESSLQLGCAMYALAYCYAQRHDAHVRVDIFYTHLSPRGKATIDVICGLMMFLPVIGLLVGASWVWAIKSWTIQEKMVETYWYPPYYPLRTVVAIGWTMLGLQGLAGILRSFYTLIRNKAYD